ncbi:thermonuclease family protein [Brevibacillus borstelensis]|uniref:thermonuclease family protein n=1 Tax=Brevibacillus borstelensis TaxID=45462 RepID=UPI0004691D57
MQYLVGILGLILIIGLVISLLGWLLNNIIGFIGIALAIWGIYEWKVNKNLGAKSKMPGFIMALGLVIAIGWFSNVSPEQVNEARPVATSIPSSTETSDSSNKVTTQISTETATGTTLATSPTTSQPIASTSTENNPANISAKVLEVVDGDTIKVQINGKEETVRFLLVDTPETKHPTYGEQPFGKEASNFVKELLSGKTVELEQDVNNGPDKYGRLLYYVYVDGKSVQEQLLEKGLARVAYVYVPNVKYVDKYHEIQAKAQKAGVGIWSIENYAQEDGYHAEVVKKEESKPTATASKPLPKQEPQPEQASNNPKLRYDPFGPDRDCGDFASQAEAQAFFEAAGGPASDPHRLDRDNDGLACEQN